MCAVVASEGRIWGPVGMKELERFRSLQLLKTKGLNLWLDASVFWLGKGT